MDLVPLPNSTLDIYGLPSWPWLIRDPENTRYLIGQTEAMVVQRNADVIGLLVRHTKVPQQIAYLYFRPDITPADRQYVMATYAADRPISITTYCAEGESPAQQWWDALGLHAQIDQLWYQRSLHQLPVESRQRLSYAMTPLAQAPDMWRSLYRQCFPQQEWAYINGLVDDPFAQRATVCIAAHDHGPVGFWLSLPYFSTTAFLCWIGLLPETRGQGYAQELMDQYLRQAQGHGMSHGALLVRPDHHKARKLYESHGFTLRWTRWHLSG
jgi:ribosomal protein S18 acetylase RimI-like enzyme